MAVLKDKLHIILQRTKCIHSERDWRSCLIPSICHTHCHCDTSCHTRWIHIQTSSGSSAWHWYCHNIGVWWWYCHCEWRHSSCHCQSNCALSVQIHILSWNTWQWWWICSNYHIHIMIINWINLHTIYKHKMTNNFKLIDIAKQWIIMIYSPATVIANELLSNTVLPPSVNRNTTFVVPNTLGLAMVTVRLPAVPAPLSMVMADTASTDSEELERTESVNGVLVPLTVTLNVNGLFWDTRCSVIEDTLGSTVYSNNVYVK